jgi:C-terminal processing protease CtpA/Prc
LAVEVIRIEENSRVSNDGRMRIGDQIVEINGLPCSQISFARARLHLRELAKIAEPTIAFQRQRQIQPLQNSLVQQPNSSSSLIGKESGALANKPVVTALQQGNTSAIGRTKCVTIKKGLLHF